MNPEALEHFGADQSRHKHESPEIKGVPWMLEEPESIHKAITISLNNVIQRIQLQNMVKPSGMFGIVVLSHRIGVAHIPTFRITLIIWPKSRKNGMIAQVR